jgi:hypothetical protein
MSSRRDLILDALMATLGGGGKPAGLTVSRSRTTAFASTQLPGQALYALHEQIIERVARGMDNKTIVKRRLSLCVETRVAAGVTTSDQALDQYLSWTVQALCAVQSVGVDGDGKPLAHDITEEGTVWSTDEQDAVYAGAKQLFDVIYTTSGSDPDAATAG